MSDGNVTVIEKLQNLVEKGDKIDAKTRDILLFSAIIDIYKKLDVIQKDTQPAVLFARGGIWVVGAVVLGIIGFFVSVWTGKVELIFK